ncbi:MAG: twin-arginine translocation signal domain-containing protein [Pseudomonadota bacterium]
MSRKENKTTVTLSDSDIKTERRSVTRGRRGFLGLVALGGATALTGTPAAAQASDSDSGNWTDPDGCGRGTGGEFTGATDADNGAITDAGGYGRGAPTC